jgi:hypothetical protein
MAYAMMNPGVPWSLVKGGFHKSPSFKTLLQKTVTGRGDGGIALKPFATWEFEVDLNTVEGGEAMQASVLQWFLGCFMATCGGAGLFLFTDPNDNTVSDAGLTTPQSCLLNTTPGAASPMGTAPDGASTQWQLARKIDQGIDLIQQATGVQVFVNGSASNATVSTTGAVTFATPPAVGAVLTWSGSFQYLCRFNGDTLDDLARVNKNVKSFLWSCGSIKFESQFV